VVVRKFATYQAEVWSRFRSGVTRFTPELDQWLRDNAGKMTRKQAAAALDMPYNTVRHRIIVLNIQWPDDRRWNGLSNLTREDRAKAGRANIKKAQAIHLARNVEKYERLTAAVDVPEWVPEKHHAEYRAICTHKNQRLADAVMKGRLHPIKRAYVERYYKREKAA
jgi:hypothetical protein